MFKGKKIPRWPQLTSYSATNWEQEKGANILAFWGRRCTGGNLKVIMNVIDKGGEFKKDARASHRQG